MSLTEILTEVPKLSVSERKVLLTVLLETESQAANGAEKANGEKPQSFAEVAAHLIGSVKSGLPSDLSANKKYLEGFGRD